MKIKLLLLLILSSPGLLLALTSDRSQPLNIEADHVFIDDKNGIMVYSGNAVFTQGSIVVTSDEVRVYTRNRKFTRAVSEGRPATFEQVMDDGKRVRARAYEMEYLLSEQKLTLTGQAELWQNQNHIKSEQIIYRMDKEVLDAKSPESGERVRITIQPETLKEEK